MRGADPLRCVRCGCSRHSWRARRKHACADGGSPAARPPVASLWLVRDPHGAPLRASPTAEAAIVRIAAHLGVVEASAVPDHPGWAVTPEGDAYLSTSAPGVVALGGRLAEPAGGDAPDDARAAAGRIWLSREVLAAALRRPPPAEPPPQATVAKRSREPPLLHRPLRGLDAAISDAHVAALRDRGYVVIDDALPPALCARLRAEMDALESNGQMWNSQSYAGNGAAPHRHIHETQLDYKQARKHAPTFSRMEADPTLEARLCGAAPGLDGLAGHHVRIQINSGRGGCYTMHTDAGSGAGQLGDGQLLALTALFYLNENWAPADGGELRVFPYPQPAEAIAPVAGRLVLFEPRMVHEVLPSWARRYCFTLWCHAGGAQCSAQADHATHDAICALPCLADAAVLAEAWRRRVGLQLPYDADAMPRELRPLFLAETRAAIVRCAYAADEYRACTRSHAPGEETDKMLRGIAAHHTALHECNARWLLELIWQLPELESRDAPATGLVDAAVRLPELRRLAQTSAPWWV